MNTLTLYLDTTANRLVISPTLGTPATLPVFYQGDVIPVVLYLIEANPTGGLASPYSYVDDANVSVKLGLVTPSPTSATVHASVTLTYDGTAANPRWTGTLTLGSAVTTLLGSSTSKTSSLEIEVSDSATGAISTELQNTVTVYADGLKAGTPPADPAPDRYLTQAETSATFAKRAGLPGEAISLTSPDGTKTVILYVDNAGVLHTDLA